MTSLKRTAGITGAALAAVLTLSACTAETQPPEPTQTSQPTVEPTQDPEVTEAPEPAFEVGQTLDSEEAAEQAQEAGLGTYTFEDGIILVVDPAAPLPDQVREEVKAIAGDDSQTPATWDEGTVLGNKALAAREKAESAGKTVVFVVKSGLYDVDGTLLNTYYALNTKDRNIQGGSEFPTAEAALAEAHARVAAAENPSMYEVFDLTR